MATPMPPMGPMTPNMPPMPPNMPPMAPDMPAMDMSSSYAMRSSFFWGHRAQVLFAGWPGDRSGAGMYVLCLLVVVALAALLEALSAASRGMARRRRSGVLVATAVHAAKMALAYVVMLAVMSFNVGVLLAAVAGHAGGFLAARSGVLRLGGAAPGDDADAHAPTNGASLTPGSEPKPDVAP